MKAYQANGKAGSVTRETPRAAAVAYFDAYPASRKCNITEGTKDGAFFTVRYGRASTGDWPQSWKNVTKKTMSGLPGED